MVHIVRDAGGVPGLHVAYDCFTEEVEERLFRSGDETSFFQHALGGPATATATRTGNAPRHPTSWPADYTRVCNLIRDCGLVPDLVPPDYCLPLLYPPGAGFALHFDSRYRWAEVIMGVNLGQDGEMMFLPTKDDDKAALAAVSKIKTARVKLPRRSIYVMSGPSRLDWKHGIVQQRPTDPPPSWNPHNLRKSLTLRSTKVFSDVYFERALRQNSAERNSLLARQRAQARFPPRNAQGEALTDEVLQKERKLAHQVLQLMESGLLPADLRFKQGEVTFSLPPGVTGGVTNRTVSEPNQNATTAAASANSASAFHGEGYRLGTGHNDTGGGGDGIQQAINASLQSLAAERAKRKQRTAGRGDPSSSSSAASPSPTKRGRKGDRGSSGTTVIDLAGDSDEAAEEKKQDDGDKMEEKMPANRVLDGDDGDIIVID